MHFELQKEAKDIKNMRKLFTLVHEKQQPEVVKKRKFKSNLLKLRLHMFKPVPKPVSVEPA